MMFIGLTLNCASPLFGDFSKKLLIRYRKEEQALVNEGMKNIATGANPIIEKAADTAVEALEAISQPEMY